MHAFSPMFRFLKKDKCKMSHSSSSSSHNYFIWIFIFIKNSFFFFITACDKHITSIIVLLVNSWLDLTDWLYLHSNKKIRCRAWANFSNYIFPLTIILFLLKTGGLIVKLINPMFLSGNEWIADIKPNFSIASISLFPTFFWEWQLVEQQSPIFLLNSHFISKMNF